MLQRIELARLRRCAACYLCVTRNLAFALLLAPLLSAPVQALEARHFVMNSWTLAMNPAENECAGVPPGSPTVIARSSLRLLGHDEKEAERLAQEFNLVFQEFNTDFAEIEKRFSEFTTRRARIDGKPVNAYLNPLAARNPQIPMATSRKQYGFNLDGKGADSKDSIEDPETHERGVDNQYARAVGCMTLYRFDTNSGQIGAAPDAGFYWFENRHGNRATVITVAGEDLSKNGDVIVTVRRSLDAPILNSKSEAQADATFRIDPDRRTLNVFRGKLKDGVVNSVEAVDFWMVSEPTSNFDYKLMLSRLRIELKPDGAVRGMIGGYRPWRDIYAPYVVVGSGWEFMSTINLVGLFYNLRDAADAFPDKQGHNSAISSAWKFTGVPAFVATVDGKPEPPTFYEALLQAAPKVDRVAGVSKYE